MHHRAPSRGRRVNRPPQQPSCYHHSITGPNEGIRLGVARRPPVQASSNGLPAGPGPSPEVLSVWQDLLRSSGLHNQLTEGSSVWYTSGEYTGSEAVRTLQGKHSRSTEPHMVATYADDTALITASTNRQRSLQLAQSALDDTVDYYGRWRIKNNASKTQAFLFGKNRSRNIPRLASEGTPIEWTRALTYLGVTLDPMLQSRTHIQLATRKATRARGAMIALLGMRSNL